MVTCRWSQNQCMRIKITSPWKAWINSVPLLTKEIKEFDSSAHCAYLNILAAATCMPFPTVIVRTFHHSVVHWCALRDAKIYGYWSMSCLTLFCMSILAPLERSSCTTWAWPLLPASMRAVCPFWGDKIYYNIVLQTSRLKCHISLIRRCSYHYFYYSFVCGYYLKVEFTFLESPRTSTIAG